MTFKKHRKTAGKLFLLCLTTITLALSACDKSFLEGSNESVHQFADTLFITSQMESTDLSINLGGARNSHYIISQIPKWIQTDDMEGNLVNGELELTFSTISNPDFSAVGNYSGQVIIHIEGLGYYSLQVIYTNVGNPKLAINPSTINFGTSLTSTVVLTNSAENSLLLWKIKELPAWLKANVTQGSVQRFSPMGIEFTVVRADLPVGDYWFDLIFMNNSDQPEIKLPVRMTVAQAQISLSQTSLALSNSSVVSIVISNTDPSTQLDWQVTGIPSWLSVSTTVGSTAPLSNKTVKFSSVTNGMSPGVYNAVVTITSNSQTPSISIPVSLVVADVMDPNSLTMLEGDVVDVEFYKPGNRMVIVSKSPNKLQLFNAETNSITSVSLPAIPNCVSISADGNGLLIGNTNGTIIKTSISAPETQQLFNIDCIPYDIVYGSNDWCYITPTEDQWVHFRSMNLQTGEITLSQSSSAIYEQTIIKRVGNSDKLVGTRMHLSPTGILLFNTSNGVANANINYWHKTIGPFWMSENGDRILCSSGKIYRTPEYVDISYIQTDISPIGDLVTWSNASIKWIDHCEAANRLLVIRNNSDYSNPAGFTVISKYNAFSYEELGTYYINPILTEISGSTNYFETSGHFLFSNNAGTSMFVVKNIRASYNKGSRWSIEKINIEE